MRTVFNFLLAMAIAYVATAALVFLFQSRLVYFPQVEREFHTTPKAAGLVHEDVALKTSDGVSLHAWWISAPEAKGAVLLFHGNAGNISHRIGYATMFVRLGYSVLLVDYRGYGKSGGVPHEEGTYLDAQAAWDHLAATRGFPARDIVIFGESLGGGVASWLAARHTPRALVLASTFKSVPDLGAEVYWWLPVRLLARIRYDNLSRITAIAVPVLIAHSKEDEIIPYAHGRALFEAARQPKSFLILSGGHNDGFIYAREEWVAALRSFLTSP